MSASSAPKSLGKATRLRSIKNSPYQEDDKPRRVAIYVRVSMEEQAEGHSLDEQERRCRAFLARDKPHWTLVGVFKDEHSGKTDKRPGFQDLIHLVDEGKVDAILCHHLDRFSRKLHDILVYFKQLEDQGVVLAFAEDRFDFSTANGMLEFHVLAVFADGTCRTCRAKPAKASGPRVERRAQQPAAVRLHQGFGRQTPIVPEEGEALREGFELYATGTYVDRQIADLFNARGLHTRKGKLWSKESIRDLLHNDFDHGVIEYRTDLYPGNHPPLITKELFDQALEARRKHRRAPRANSNRMRTYMLNTLWIAPTAAARCAPRAAGSTAIIVTFATARLQRLSGFRPRRTGLHHRGSGRADRAGLYPARGLAGRDSRGAPTMSQSARK